MAQQLSNQEQTISSRHASTGEGMPEIMEPKTRKPCRFAQC
jgi:hypothetical protein